MPEIRAKVLSRFWPRLKGLLGTRIGDPKLTPVLLERCRSIHTFGMHYRLDVAFIDRKGRVVNVQRNVAPGRRLRSRAAVSVLERPATKQPWPMTGQRLLISKTYQDKQGREFRNVKF